VVFLFLWISQKMALVQWNMPDNSSRQLYMASFRFVSKSFDRWRTNPGPKTGRLASLLWDEPTATIETGVLQLQVRSCGTAFQLNCDKLTLAFNDLSGYYKTFLFGCWDHGALWLTVKVAPHKFSYLVMIKMQMRPRGQNPARARHSSVVDLHIYADQMWSPVDTQSDQVSPGNSNTRQHDARFQQDDKE